MAQRVERVVGLRMSFDRQRRFGFGGMVLFEFAADQTELDSTLARLEESLKTGRGAPLAIVAGPGEIGIRALVQGEGGTYEVSQIELGQEFAIAESASARSPLPGGTKLVAT